MITNPLSDLTVGVFVVAVLAAAAALVWLLKRMRERRPSSKHDVAVAPSTHPELVAQEAPSPAQPTELQISPPPLQVQAEEPALSASADSQMGSSNPESAKRRGEKKRHSKGRSLKTADSKMHSSSSPGTTVSQLATELTSPSCPRGEPASDASGGKSATSLQRQPSKKSLGSTHLPRPTRLVGDVPKVPPELDIFSREHTSMTASPQQLSPGVDSPAAPSAMDPANRKSSHRTKGGHGSDSRRSASEQKNPEASEPNNDVPPELDTFSREHTSMTASPQPLSPGVDSPTTPSATDSANRKSSHKTKRGRGSDSRKAASELKNPEALEPNNDVRRAPKAKTSLGPSPP